MRSEIVKKILDETPQAVTDKVREYANNLVTKRPMEIEQKERERIEKECGSDSPYLAGRIQEHIYLQKEVIQPMQSVMIAAAEEIMRVWPAHCDAEGYGPTNLMHRLEQGIPSQYGYTAGAFAKLEAENKALREALKNMREWLSHDASESENKTFLDDIARVDQLLKNEG